MGKILVMNRHQAEMFAKLQSEIKKFKKLSKKISIKLS